MPWISAKKWDLLQAQIAKLSLGSEVAKALSKLDLILAHQKQFETEIMLDFTKIIEAAQKQQGVTNSVLQFCQDTKKSLADLSAQLAAALAANDPTAIKAAQAQLDAIADGFDKNDDAIAAAITDPGQAGTPPPAKT